MPVSILTQLLCWVQPPPLHKYHATKQFQSSPSFYAGCNTCTSWRSTRSTSFNPHPAFMLGATLSRQSCAKCREFQSSPSFYAGCNVENVLHSRCTFESFNPHPAFMLGATVLLDLKREQGNMFQSSPSFYAGCNVHY